MPNMTRIAGVAAVTLLTVPALPAISKAQEAPAVPICSVIIDRPSAGTGGQVRGSASIGSCESPTASVIFEVCLMYGPLVLANTCKIYTGTGSASGSTGPSPCLPGMWFTQVAVAGQMGDRYLSDPSVFDAQCRDLV